MSDLWIGDGLSRRLGFQIPVALLSYAAALAALADELAWGALAPAAGFVLVHALAYELFRADRLKTDPPGFYDALTFACASAGGSLVAWTALRALELVPPGQAFFLEPCAHLLLLLAWLAWRRLAAAAPPRDVAPRALFLHTRDAQAMVSALTCSTVRPLEPVGWLDERRDRLGCSADGLPVLGAVAELPYLVDWHQIEAVVALVGPHQSELAERLCEFAEEAAVELILLPDFSSALRTARSNQSSQPVSSAA